MNTGSLNLTPLFTCGLRRSEFRSLPLTLNNTLTSLRKVSPPIDIQAFHSADHLISFAHHVQELLARPVEIKELDGHRLVYILGQAVLARTPDGILDLYLWSPSIDDRERVLEKVKSVGTPFLDFPRTSLWIKNLQQAFQQEARTRIGVGVWADRWAKWAWSWIQFKVISRVDVRRLRAQIRGALDLDPVVLRLLHRRHSFAARAAWSVRDYNAERIYRDATLLLEHEAPALLPLYWALREHSDIDPNLEPKKALRQFARLSGIAPQQWKVIAESGRRGQRVYRALCREFFVGTEFENAISYLKLIRFFRPKRLPTIEFWRQILSLCGTCDNPCRLDYADTLVEYQDILRHIVHLTDARTLAREKPFPDAELHAVLGWIADRQIKRLTKSQRSGGWAFLVRSATRYRKALVEPVVGPLLWDPVLPGFEAGQLRVVPLTSAASVWEEAIDMRHCADRYIEQCVRREVALFSLQRHTGKRIATAAFLDNGTQWVRLELAGKANSEPTLEARRVAVLIDERMQRVAVRPPPEEPKPPLSSAVSFDEALSFYEVLDREEVLRRSITNRGSGDPPSLQGTT